MTSTRAPSAKPQAEPLYEPKGIRKSSLSRADLLLLKHRCADDALEDLSPLVGYYRKPSSPEKEPEPDASDTQITDQPTPPEAPQQKPPPRFVNPTFYRIIHYQAVSTEDATSQLQALASTAPLDLHAQHQGELPLYSPLASWPKLWPFVRAALGQAKNTQRLDAPRLTAMIAKQEALQTLPYLKRTAWADHCHLIVDYNHATQPFWEDYNQLLHFVTQWRGAVGEMKVSVMDNGPQNGCRPWGVAAASMKPYRLPQESVPVLILADLGCFDAAGVVRRHWLKLGQRFQTAGFRPVVLMPSQRALKDEQLKQYFTLMCWDQRRQFPTQLPCQSARPMPLSDAQKGVDRLLTLLSPFLKVEPSLLRAARKLLASQNVSADSSAGLSNGNSMGNSMANSVGPCVDLNVDSEALIWAHPDVESNATAFAIKTEAIQGYRHKFKNLDRCLQLAVGDLIQSHHRHLPDVIRYEELATYFDLMGFDDVEKQKALKATLDKYQQRLAATLYRQKDKLQSAAGLTAYVRRHSHRQNAGIWNSPWLRAAWALTYQAELKAGQVELPPGLTLNQVMPFVPDLADGQFYTIRQQGHQLRVAGQGEAANEAKKSAAMTSLFLPGDLIEVSQPGQSKGQGKGLSFGQKMSAEKVTEISLSPHHPIILSAGTTALTIAPFTKPRWAKSVGYDGHGLFAELSCLSVVQRFRWINPGQFLMGSPESELKRFDDERQHEVHLSEGYWLADTACTQTLWQAVMGENPSHFKAGDKPVEQVSWHDTKKFIDQLNQENPGLAARLPSEAEWEYACRAGTQGPFSFGENITPAQVNYNGSEPYAEGEKGLFRNETVAVKTLPVNPWGLYEMHGNVWEWCEDWFQGEYHQDSKVNPVGPDRGQRRVVRGGGWIDFGRLVRSAGRGWFGPDFRLNYLGFRLALGHPQ